MVMLVIVYRHGGDGVYDRGSVFLAQPHEGQRVPRVRIDIKMDLQAASGDEVHGVTVEKGNILVVPAEMNPGEGMRRMVCRGPHRARQEREQTYCENPAHEALQHGRTSSQGAWFLEGLAISVIGVFLKATLFSPDHERFCPRNNRAVQSPRRSG